MQEEIDYLHKPKTYDPVELSRDWKCLKNEWVFKLKNNGQKKVMYKTRLVVKGFEQKQDIEFVEFFSLVVKIIYIRIILGLPAYLLEIEQLDVKIAFLHGDLEEKMYMKQPKRFKGKGKEYMTCKLKKSIYGFKQAPRQMVKKFDLFMLDHGYKRTSAYHCVYIKHFS